MNKLFVAVFVVAISASYGFFINNLPFVCKEEKDCGAHKCCAFGKICFPKLGANAPCGGNLANVHKCGCDDGLECKVTKTITVSVGDNVRKVDIKQCRAADEEVAPEEIEYDEGVSREKRFFRGSIDAITGAVTGGFDKLFRKCSVDNDCGVKRCCASYPLIGKRCRPAFGLYHPCPKNPHCCGEGLECRSGLTLNTTIPGRPAQTHIDLKFCVKESDPVVPPIEVDSE